MTSALQGPTIWESCIRPLVISMTMCGMNLNTRKGVNNWSRSIFTTGSSIMLTTYCLTCNIQTLRKLVWLEGDVNGRQRPLSSASLILSTVFRVLCSLGVIVMFALRRHRISAIFWKLHRCLHIVPGAKVRSHIWRIKMQVVIGCVVCWAAMFYFIYANVLRNTEEPITNNYGYTMQFDNSLKGLYWWKLVFAHVFDVTLLIASTVGPMSFFSVAFILFCSTLATIVNDFNAWMNESANETKSAIRLKTFRSIRKALARLVEEANDAFSPITFFVFGILLADMFKYTYFLVSNRDRLCLLGFMYMTPILTRMLYVTLLFILVSASAVIVTDKLEDTLPILNRLSSEMGDCLGNAKLPNGKVPNQSQGFDSILSSPSQLTAWNLFPINRRFLLLIVSLVAVYAIVVFNTKMVDQDLKISEKATLEL